MFKNNVLIIYYLLTFFKAMKNTFLFVLLLCGICGIAQVKPTIDTLLDADSLSSAIKNEVQTQLSTIILEEDDLEDNESNPVSSILTAGRDPFLSTVAYNFSIVRFRLRGYENNSSSVYINGIDFNGLDNGYIPFGLWGGLNSVMRSQQNVYGIGVNDFSFGNIALNTHIDLRASAQRAQTQVGYALSNRNYTHRITLHHGSGFDKKGWAYSFAFTGRYATEGYVPGTYYQGVSYYAAVDKKISRKDLITLITFGAPTEVGRQNASVREAMDIAGSNYYNSSWGWQNGKKRNANVLQTYQPVLMAIYDHKPTEKSSLLTTIAYLWGKRKNSGVDWYNASDPRPDYYRYLPSYYRNDNPTLSQLLYDYYRNNPDALQIQWDRLYESNIGNIRTIKDVDGIPNNDITGKRSVYILSNRVIDMKRIIANTIYNHNLNKRVLLTLGANYQQQINHYYQEVKDLLGGDFWININQFAERDYPNDQQAIQHDLNQPNRIVKEGEQYGYNYKITIHQAMAWGQLLFNLNRFDFFTSIKISQTGFFRTGINRNGLFPDNSYGDAPKQNFMNVGVKAGITYKINGRNYLFINSTYRTSPPFFENAYVSQRTRNTVQEGLTSEKIFSNEAGYKLNTPRIRLGISGYYTSIINGVDVLTFYHDQYQSFVNYALSNINKIFYGGELGVEIKLTSILSFNGSASVGRYYYNSRQHAVITADNNASNLGKQIVYLKNYRIPSTPQNAYSAGFFYRSPKFWYVSFSSNYFDNMWLSPNPLRRTVEAIADTDPENPSSEVLQQSILRQEKFPRALTLDFFGGGSKLLPRSNNNRRTYILYNIGVSNLLNRKNITSGGFEQLRFDFEEKNVDKFPPRYYYAYGINFFASIGLRF